MRKRVLDKLGVTGSSPVRATELGSARNASVTTRQLGRWRLGDARLELQPHDDFATMFFSREAEAE